MAVGTPDHVARDICGLDLKLSCEKPVDASAVPRHATSLSCILLKAEKVAGSFRMSGLGIRTTDATKIHHLPGVFKT